MTTQKSILTMAAVTTLSVLCHVTIPAACAQEAATPQPSAFSPANAQPGGPPQPAAVPPANAQPGGSPQPSAISPANAQPGGPPQPAAVPPASVQPAGPPKLSTNPCQHVIFPAKNQTPAQQEQDQLDAYNWATQQTGWDPYQATAQQAQLEGKAAGVSGATRGAAVGGAARGALVGVAVGAIAGDAGEGAAIGATAGGMASGMRGRKMRKQVETSTQAAQTGYQQKLASWDKHFIAAMKGKGYTVE